MKIHTEAEARRAAEVQMAKTRGNIENELRQKGWDEALEAVKKSLRIRLDHGHNRGSDLEIMRLVDEIVKQAEDAAFERGMELGRLPAEHGFEVGKLIKGNS